MRVIAGSKKGMELSAPKGLHTRPTLAKVKEAMFGMIQFDLADAEVLDLFSGSGSLGIEAVSRGAIHAVLVDSDRNAVSVIKSNVKRLGLDENISVVYGDSLAYLGRLSGKRFDIVLLDPPYGSDLESAALSLLDEYRLLNDGAIVICEHSKDNPPVFTENYSHKDPRRYGDCYLTYAVYSLKEGE